MTEEAQATEEPKQEAPQQEAPEQPAERQVPLAALEAERKKRQEAEARLSVLEEMRQQAARQPAKEEEEDDLVTTKSLLSLRDQIKRETAEEVYVMQNPEAKRLIEENLPQLIQEKPWIKAVIANAPNRWQQAFEIVSMYSAKPAPKAPPSVAENERRLEKNAAKPGVSAKSQAQISRLDLINSKIGTPEFGEWSRKVMRGEIPF